MQAKCSEPYVCLGFSAVQAIALNPSHCRAYYNRAFSHDRLNQYEAAVADYSRALAIEPLNATAYHNRGSLYERLSK